MRIENELLYQDLGKLLVEHSGICNIDYNAIIQTNALKALKEIKTILQSEADDFMKVDEIINVFGKYSINVGACHDFY